MKKKLKLRPGVKVLLTCICFIIYFVIGILSGFVSANDFEEMLTFTGFFLLVESEILLIVSL